MLYVWYVQLKRAKHIHKKQIHSLVSVNYDYKDYDRKGSVGNISDLWFQGACNRDELTGGKPSVVK
jgi:hypothetical protein